MELLSRYNFKIIYRPGKQNTKADALTRRGDKQPANTEDKRELLRHQTLLPPKRFGEVNLLTIGGNGPEGQTFYDNIKQANTNNRELRRLRKAVRCQQFEDIVVDLRQATTRQKVLYWKGKLWVPTTRITQIIYEAHAQRLTRHPGVRHTLDIVGRYYFWPGMRASISQYVRNCHNCRRSKASRDRQNGLIHPLPIPEQRWKDLGVDFITGLPPYQGQNAILTCIDRLSKERIYSPMYAAQHGTTAEETAKVLFRDVFSRQGLPDSIVSDRGPQFTSTVWDSLCNRLGIQMRLSTAYHPETDGQTERANQEVKGYLRAFCNHYQDDWFDLLPMASAAHN